MFDGLIYEINTRLHTLNVTIVNDSDIVRSLRGIDEGGRIHVLCNSEGQS